MINIEDYKYISPIHARWSDLDPLSHVNNAVYVTYFEAARGPFMLEACKGWDWTKHMFLIAHVEVSFLKELKLTSKKPVVRIKTKKIGTKSFVLEYIIVSVGKDNKPIIHAHGTSTQIMFDMKTRTTIEIEPWIKEGLEKFA